MKHTLKIVAMALLLSGAAAHAPKAEARPLICGAVGAYLDSTTLTDANYQTYYYWATYYESRC